MTSSAKHEDQYVNVGTIERVASVLGGWWAIKAGLRHGGLSGLALVGLGLGFMRRGATGHCPMYARMGKDTFHHGTPRPREYFEHGIHVERSCTINKPAAELFRYWRSLENLPHIMSHLKEVTPVDQKRSHWKAGGPAGYPVEWDAEIVNEEPDKLIAWRSVSPADVHSAGSVRFMENGGRTTEVRVVLEYLPPAGRVGAAIARLLGDEPGQQIDEDLRRFKRLMESGGNAESQTTAGRA